MTRRVLLATSANWLASVATPGLLRDAGCTVDVLGPPGTWASRSGAVARRFAAPSDARDAAEALRRHLECHGRYDWIIIGDDLLLAALAARRDEPWLDGVLPTGPREASPSGGTKRSGVLPIERGRPEVELLGSKAGLARVCRRHEIGTPRTAIVTTVEAARAAAEAIGYPVLLKLDRSSGGDGTWLVRDAVELEAQFPTEPGEVVVQERVAGPIWSIEALFGRSRPIAWATSIMERVWPAPFGASSVRRFRAAPGVRDLVWKVGAAVAPHGFANMSAVVEAGTGRFLLFELDLRPNAALPLARFAGVDFARGVRAILDGDTAAPELSIPQGRDVVVRLYPQEIVRCLEEPDLSGLLACLLDWRALPWADGPLQRAYLAYIARRAVRKVLQRVRFG